MMRFNRNCMHIACSLAVITALSSGGACAQDFTDIDSHWGKDVILELTGRDVINGYPDGSFRPDDTITRAEFSKILFESLGKEEKTGSPFEDTSDHWAENKINTLVEDGVIDAGEYGDSFVPDGNITRIEMAKMVDRALLLDEDAKSFSGATPFNDDEDIVGNDKGYVHLAVEKKIINGYPDNTFRPDGEATRAEAGKMMKSMFDVIESVTTSQEKQDTSAKTSETVDKDGIRKIQSFPFENLADAIPSDKGAFWMSPYGHEGSMRGTKLYRVKMSDFPLRIQDTVVYKIEPEIQIIGTGRNKAIIIYQNNDKGYLGDLRIELADAKLDIIRPRNCQDEWTSEERGDIFYDDDATVKYYRTYYNVVSAKDRKFIGEDWKKYNGKDLQYLFLYNSRLDAVLMVDIKKE